MDGITAPPVTAAANHSNHDSLGPLLPSLPLLLPPFVYHFQANIELDVIIASMEDNAMVSKLSYVPHVVLKFHSFPHVVAARNQ